MLKQYEEFIGARFGKLKVNDIFRNHENRACANCTCDCGNFHTLLIDNLKKSSSTISCGCIPKTDLTGQRFGCLVVLRYLKLTPRPFYLWLCQCDCGRTREVLSYNLTSLYTKNCGDLSVHPRKIIKSRGDIQSSYLSQIRCSAKIRNLEVNITLEYLWDIFIAQNKQCALSGMDIVFGNKSKRYPVKQTASLDRIDSSKGYIIGNVQWVHRDINFMKQAYDQEYFIDLCQKIVNHKRKISIIQ